MLRSDNSHSRTPSEATDSTTRNQVAIVPLAIPIVAGPGTMATVIIAAERNSGLWPKVELSIAVIALALLVGVLSAYSRPIATRFGTSGMGSEHGSSA